VMSIWTIAVVGLSPIGAAITASVGAVFDISAAIFVAAAVILATAGMVVVAVRCGYVREVTRT
jgi:hypothetical protein